MNRLFIHSHLVRSAVQALKKRFALAFVASAVIVLSACDPSISTPIGNGSLGNLVASGTAVRYVAIGNSLTAGYQSGAVVGQEVQYAYPVLLAKQLGIAVGTNADQFAYMQFDNNAGIGGRLNIKEFDATGTPTTASTALGSTPTNATLPRPYNNLGIPGALLRDMLPGSSVLDQTLYGARFVTTSPLYNPFFRAVLRGTPGASPLGANVVDQAARLQPNLVSIWIGNNDVLGYASSGGASGTNLEFFTMQRNPQPTEVAVFTAQFNTLMDSAAARMPSAKLIVGNIPDVLAAPYFTTVGPRLRASIPALLGTLPAAIGTVLRTAFPNFPNGFPVGSSAVPGGIKPLSDADLFVLPASTGFQTYVTQLVGRISANPAMAQQIILQNPIPNSLVLDEAEQAVVRASTTAFNNAIQLAVNRYSSRAVLFDANAIVGRVRTQGYPVSGSTVLRFDYISGGFFSLDGIHPSSRGYGAVTNEMIELLNKSYGANIAKVPLQDIPGLPIGQPTF